MSSEPNVLSDKSFAFGVRIFKLSQFLQRKQREFVVSKQLVRCGTSIGANTEEVVGSISKADFSLKMSIASKETHETSYWLRLRHAANCLSNRQLESIHLECQELCKILFSILRTGGRTE